MRTRVMSRIAVGALLGCALAVPTSAGAEEGVTPGHLLNVQNTMKGAPSNATELVFPMTMQQPPGQKGYFWAQTFYFRNKKSAYTGIRPEAVNPDGTSVNTFGFSTFDPGATTDDPNCTPGADGGPGASCGLRTTIATNRTYDLHVKIVSNDGQRQKVEGTAVDTATGQPQHIGSWSLPSSVGSPMDTPVSFLEHYGSVPSCEAMPHGSVLLGAPRVDGKAYPMTNAKIHNKQKCPGKGVAALENGGLRMSN